MYTEDKFSAKVGISVVSVIIAAAGQGKRMGAGVNKVLLPLAGKPVLLHCIETFSRCPQIDELIIVAAPEELAAVERLLGGCQGLKPYKLVSGGSERQYSVANALQAVAAGTQVVLVHDGARPLVEAGLIAAVIQAAGRHGAAIAAVPVKNTIKAVDKDGFVSATLPRHSLWAVQTPQAFRCAVLRQAYEYAAKAGLLATDDAALVEQLGVRVKVVDGAYDNVKITTPEDLRLATAVLKQGCDEMVRFGMGYDVHRLVEGRKLILGGVDIPHSHGLLGHSDADVLLHAVKDALLGAAALGDIGRHFPDSDDRYKGASSLLLLARIGEILREHGYKINNIDATIVAEEPRLAPFIPAMNGNIAAVLELDCRQVNVKATTTEGLGFAGQKEGIAAYAVAAVEG
ncbi:2-C-methyl-D-erythritol 4-phosphate cytidylyltransferase|uniref:Bifunctional enzyme IspD/IspF n=1 Tax=Dendrosporobacter quercicolus TaxID=146817 RepID=A0A1G9V2X6_9FIRM|nr:2-C-methyl-D-erythritol 4-phosphate cytidylyltransferase [Dendrosporobacter quercicolus]NSL47939.1 2-C-methyl-D-erythritol 4-phosphate cytidylyltransferase [Dendrosporobacter quercicolus DSM 1736]SDM66584.1 2-C-methyl-D-erythritol 2,4-cyclodiphosphate synthase [Dendrosporobacter quercicolus]